MNDPLNEDFDRTQGGYFFAQISDMSDNCPWLVGNLQPDERT